ncbi:unnamed protein product [Lota lota]
MTQSTAGDEKVQRDTDQWEEGALEEKTAKAESCTLISEGSPCEDMRPTSQELHFKGLKGPPAPGCLHRGLKTREACTTYHPQPKESCRGLVTGLASEQGTECVHRQTQSERGWMEKVEWVKVSKGRGEWERGRGDVVVVSEWLELKLLKRHEGTAVEEVCLHPQSSGFPV